MVSAVHPLSGAANALELLSASKGLHMVSAVHPGLDGRIVDYVTGFKGAAHG